MKRKVKQPLDGQQILKYQQNEQSPLALKTGITCIPFKYTR